MSKKTKEPDLIKAIRKTLSDSKLFKNHLPNFTPRIEQIDMACMIGYVFLQDEIATIQAGTGVGKSFAYLIPAILWATSEDEPVVISTATTNLQDQLWQKDIPLLRKVLDTEFEALVVKGAQQYLCLDRLTQIQQSLLTTLNSDEQEQLDAVSEWSSITETAQKSELSFEPSSKLWREIEVSTTICLYDSCQFFNQCGFINERKKIPRANIIITNHSLLLSDLLLKSQSDGAAYILPEYSRLIIDEAQKFPDAATDALTVTINPKTTHSILSRIYNPEPNEGLLPRINTLSRHLPAGKGERTKFARSISKTEETVARTLQSMTYLFERLIPLSQPLITPHEFYTTKQTYNDEWLQTHEMIEIRDNELENFQNLLGTVTNHLHQLQLYISRIEETETTLRFHKEIQFAKEQVSSLVHGLKVIFAEQDDDVRWIELPPNNKNISFKSAPLSVDHFLGPFLYEQMKTLVFTSATLAPGQTFSFFHDSLGLNEFETHRQTTAILHSSFPYDKHALLLIPKNVPEPTAVSFQENINTIIPAAIAASRGRALVLFTSHEMLQNTFNSVQEKIENQGYTCLAQGLLSRTSALKQFREDVNSVLFGTASFWDGIDVLGESLSMVIIIRLPFSVPNDPIIEARSKRLSEKGKNPFLDYQLPQAAMRLQQGFGRLIRSEIDRGVVLCLDKRLVTRNYGKYILDSLPPCRIIQDKIEKLLPMVTEFLDNGGE